MPWRREGDLPLRVLVMLVVTGVMLGLWSGPAFAATAPLCDERGATVLAPPPALPSGDEAISRGRAPCRNGASPIARTLFAAPGPGHAVPDSLVDATDAATPALAIHLPAPAGSAFLPVPRADAPSPGVRSRVERPPRA